MKVADSSSTSGSSSASHVPASGLRTGKIHVTKSSAAQILRTIGVTRADERVAAKALMIAAMGLKAPKDVKKVVTVKRTRPATTKKP